MHASVHMSVTATRFLRTSTMETTSAVTIVILLNSTRRSVSFASASHYFFSALLKPYQLSCRRMAQCARCPTTALFALPLEWLTCINHASFTCFDIRNQGSGFEEPVSLCPARSLCRSRHQKQLHKHLPSSSNYRTSCTCS